jgi:pimeloyl-ACP methyl ester carboxylesterase
LQSYVDRVSSVVAAQAEPVILAGHSMGGIAISQVAEAHPDRIAALVYLCAFLLQNGESVLALATSMQDSLLLPEFIPRPEEACSISGGKGWDRLSSPTAHRRTPNGQ